MTQLSLHQLLIRNLGGDMADEDISYDPEDALHFLKEWTGQDFGYDKKLWTRWFQRNKKFAYDELLSLRKNLAG